MTGSVFFDLDGTLTDPREGITASIRYALERTGTEAPAADDLTWCIGPPLLESLTTLVGRERAPEALELYRERFGSVGLYENRVYPGIAEMLATLNAAGAKLYVASSKALVFVERIVEHFALDRHFDGVFGAELDGTRADKTELLAYALATTGAASSAATMVGDRSHDVVGALNNGMDVVGVLYGYGSQLELAQAGACRLAAAPADLARVLLPGSPA